MAPDGAQPLTVQRRQRAVVTDQSDLDVIHRADLHRPRGIGLWKNPVGDGGQDLRFVNAKRFQRASIVCDHRKYSDFLSITVSNKPSTFACAVLTPHATKGVARPLGIPYLMVPAASCGELLD